MAQQATMQAQGMAQPKETSGWVVGFAVFAGSLMLLAGIFQALEGLAAIFNNSFFVVSSSYAFSYDVTTWGWVHLLLGIIIAFAGVAVFSGQAWGRFVGILLAILSATANFFFIPYYPFWSLTIIAIDFAIIGALAVFGPREAGMPETAENNY